MITVNELFSGIGSQRKALEILGIPHSVVGISEIDKFAIKSYEAIFGETRNYGDISKINKLDYADFWTYSFPCQDISVAGKQAGVNEHTRSGLLYQIERLLNTSKEYDELPKYLMLENVKNLVGKRFKERFDKWLEYLDELGYNNYWKVLNAKNYGIPQNRERVFVISIRKDIDNEQFEFPEPFDNGLRLKHLLESSVDERYYISQEIQDRFKQQYVGDNIVGTTKSEDGTSYGQRDWVYGTDNIIGALTATDYKQPKQIIDNGLVQVGTLKGCGNPYDNMHDQSGRVYDPSGISPTIHTSGGGHQEPKVMEMPCIVASRGRYTNDGITEQQLEINNTGTTNALTTVQKDNYVIEEPQILCAKRTEYGKRIRKAYENGQIKESRHNMTHLQPREDGVANTLTTVQKDNLLLQNFRIRKLTPKECWRLMGFDDTDFAKAENVNSNTQLYKQAGNSIVVNVLQYLFANLFKEHISIYSDVDAVGVAM